MSCKLVKILTFSLISNFGSRFMLFKKHVGHMYVCISAHKYVGTLYYVGDTSQKIVLVIIKIIQALYGSRVESNFYVLSLSGILKYGASLPDVLLGTVPL